MKVQAPANLPKQGADRFMLHYREPNSFEKMLAAPQARSCLSWLIVAAPGVSTSADLDQSYETHGSVVDGSQRKVVMEGRRTTTSEPIWGAAWTATRTSADLHPHGSVVVYLVTRDD